MHGPLPALLNTQRLSRSHLDMPMGRHLLAAIGTVIGIASALSAANTAHALPVDQYLALRRSAGCDRRLSYTQVEGGSSGFLNKVFELRGTVNGSIRRENGVAFLLTIEDKHALLLSAPAADTPLVAEVRNQLVRVLARVTNGAAGNIVPLEVLGVANDGEVSIKEQEAESRLAAQAAQNAQPGQKSSASRSTSGTGRAFASRGGAYYARPMGQGQGGDIPDIARGLSADTQSVYGLYRSYIFKCNPRLAMRDLDEITTSLLYYSEKHKVDPRLVISMIIAESDFDPRSTSHKGAMGLGQIMPDEARDHGVSNPYDVVQNVRTSINLLRMKLDLYNDGAPSGHTSFRQRQLALAAYNAGAGAVKKYGGVPPYKETQHYVAKIEKIYRELCGVE